MTRPDWIRTSYEYPPYWTDGFWRAWDDRMGADDSPYGQGATEAEAIDDLMAQMESNT